MFTVLIVKDLTEICKSRGIVYFQNHFSISKGRQHGQRQDDGSSKK